MPMSASGPTGPSLSNHARKVKSKRLDQVTLEFGVRSYVKLQDVEEVKNESDIVLMEFPVEAAALAKLLSMLLVHHAASGENGALGEPALKLAPKPIIRE